MEHQNSKLYTRKLREKYVPLDDTTTVRLVAPPVSVTEPLKVEAAGFKTERSSESARNNLSLAGRVLAACLNAEIEDRGTNDDRFTEDMAKQIIDDYGGLQGELMTAAMSLCFPEADNVKVGELVDKLERPTSSPERLVAQ